MMAKAILPVAVQISHNNKDDEYMGTVKSTTENSTLRNSVSQNTC